MRAVLLPFFDGIRRREASRGSFHLACAVHSLPGVAPVTVNGRQTGSDTCGAIGEVVSKNFEKECCRGRACAFAGRSPPERQADISIMVVSE
jgi:hypothetical protein